MKSLQAPQESTSTNVSEVLETVASWYEDVADDKQIQLQAMADDNLIIQSDPEKLTRRWLTWSIMQLNTPKQAEKLV